MQTEEAVDVLLAKLREARPLAVTVTDLWRLIMGPPGQSVLHAARDELRAAGHRVTDVEVERVVKVKGEDKRVKVLAWRLDFDRKKGR